MKETTITVSGMHCNSCAMLVREALEEEGATTVNVAIDAKKQTGTVRLKSELSKQQITKIIEAQGEYKVH